MKYLYLLSAALTISTAALAQLPSGSIAPDFTANDINGNEWNLYDLLDADKSVILYFGATWVGPDWNYLQSDILQDLHSVFGPPGTGDLYVLLLESDDSTTSDDLNGTGPATTGDWVSIVNFPIIDNAGSIFNLYGNAYYPTIYTVCNDYTLVESGQASFEGHVAAAFQNCANSITGAAPLMTYNGETSSCGGGEWMASTSVSNLGSEVVTAMVFSVELNGVAQSDVTWEGVLSNGGNETVDLGSYSEIGTFDYSLVSVNGADWNAEEVVIIYETTDTSPILQVRLLTDNWPEETGWKIETSNGTFIDGIETGSLDGQINTEFTWDVALDPHECYIFTMIDTYGDGLYASQWGNYADGSFSLVSMNGMMEIGIVVSYNGATGGDFAELSTSLYTVLVSGCTDQNACNYNSLATIASTCDYSSCLGCTIAFACNYEPDATIDDFSCDFVDTDGDGICDASEIPGCTDSTANNYDSSATDDNNSCTYDVYGCVYSVACNYDPEANIYDDSCYFIGQPCDDNNPETVNETYSENCECIDESAIFGCTILVACNYNPDANFDDGSCINSGDSCDDGDSSTGYDTYSDECNCIGESIDGCTYPIASNYNYLAILDDGSCLFEVCNYENAFEDGYNLGLIDGASNDCPGDLNNDLSVNTQDLLEFLTVFGIQCN